MDHSHELGPHEWLLQTAIRHLPQALHDFQNQNVVDSHCICLSGACAVWIHALSHAVESRGEGQDSLLADEVMGILKYMPIPTYNSRYIFHAQDQELQGDEELDLSDGDGDFLAPLDVVFSTHEVPSHRFADSPIKVADGIWIILDLLLSFLETTKYDATSAYPSQTPRDKPFFIERAVSIVALLLYSLDRLGQHRHSLGLRHSEHRQPQEYESIRSHPLFPRYTSAIRWYCSPGRISKFSQVGARYYFERTRTTLHQASTDEPHRRLSHEIEISLGNLQRSLSNLMTVSTQATHGVRSSHWHLPADMHNLADLLMHPDFGKDPSPGYQHQVGYEYYESGDDSPVPVYSPRPHFVPIPHSPPPSYVVQRRSSLPRSPVTNRFRSP